MAIYIRPSGMEGKAKCVQCGNTRECQYYHTDRILDDDLPFCSMGCVHEYAAQNGLKVSSHNTMTPKEMLDDEKESSRSSGSGSAGSAGAAVVGAGAAVAGAAVGAAVGLGTELGKGVVKGVGVVGKGAIKGAKATAKGIGKGIKWYFKILGILLIIGLPIIAISECYENHSAAKGAKNQTAQEYTINDSSAVLNGSFGDYFSVKNVSIVTKAGAYEADLTVTFKCKKSLQTLGSMNSSKIKIFSGAVLSPNEESIGKALVSMKEGEEKTIKINITPKKEKYEIDNYKKFIEAAALGTVTLTFEYTNNESYSSKEL